MRPDLLALTDDILVELTNVGTVRRARKEQVASTFTFTVDGDVVTATDGDLVCVLGTGPFDSWICSCPTGSRCRHLVRAVLDWQAGPAASQVAASATTHDARDPATPGSDGKDERPHPSSANKSTLHPPATTSRRPESAAAPDTGESSAPDVEPVEVLTDSGTGALVSFAPRTLSQADKIEATGLIAEVTATDTLAIVRLLHPEHLTVRFLVGRDPRYARCECDTPGCVHVVLALKALNRLPGPGRELVSTANDRIQVADDLVVEWRAWLEQFVDLGLPAAAELMAGAVRLAGRCDDAGLAHPAAVLRGIAEQLELRLDHSSRLSPQRLLELIGEFAARLRALGRENPDLPALLVAGTRRTEIRGGQSRLIGLGAEYGEVGGWHTLRCYLLDTKTSALRTLTVEQADQVDSPLTPSALAARVRGGVRVLDFAAARGLLPPARRLGDELVLPRGRWTMLASPTLDLDDRSPALVGGITAAGSGAIPSALGPRRPADGIAVVRVAGIEQVLLRGDTVSAIVSDPDGAVAQLQLRPDDRAAGAHDLLLRTLRSGSVSAVAGRWRRVTPDAPPEVEPTAVWFDGGMLLPQLGLIVGQAPSSPVPATAPSWKIAPASKVAPSSTVSPSSTAAPSTTTSSTTTPTREVSTARADPWEAWWIEVTEVLGRILLTGARRGSRSGGPTLLRCAEQAEAIGLLRTGTMVRTLAAELPRPTSRLDPLVDLCVLLALRD